MILMVRSGKVLLFAAVVTSGVLLGISITVAC